MSSSITRVVCRVCRVSVHPVEDAVVGPICPLCRNIPCDLEDIPLSDRELTLMEDCHVVEMIRAAREIRKLRSILGELAAQPPSWYALTQESVKKAVGQ